MAPEFFSCSWADAVHEAITAGPTEEVRAAKLDKYWEWIERAKQELDCTLGLAVEDLPGANCLLLELEKGECAGTRLVALDRGLREADYVLGGDLGAWREIMGGYDIGRTIMYRKLRLLKGELLHFFRAAYFWTETLGCVQRVPTTF